MLPALSLTLALGCAANKPLTRTEDRERADLSKRAEDFWHAMRWQYPSQAAAALQDDMARRRWSMEAEALLAGRRITEAALVDLVLDPPPAEGPRLGTVVVRVEYYTLPDQVLRRETVVQTWERGPSTWYLRWAEGNPLDGQPWP